MNTRFPAPPSHSIHRPQLATTLILLAAVAGFFAPAVAGAADIDWAQVEGTTVKVFYPGVSSWDFLTGRDHGTGEAPVKTFKKACAECHVGKSGDYDINADKIISGAMQKVDSGDPLEPEPLSGMPGFKDVTLKAAYDSENLYLRLEWPGSGASVSDPSLAKDDKADRVSVQISDNIGSFAKYGCFITCHDNQSGMPENRGEEVKLYGYYTREKDGSLKSRDKLDAHLSKGQFMDLWVVAFEGPDVKAVDEYVLDTRAKNENNDLAASGGFDNGTYSAVISRKLSTGDVNDITLEEGKSFNVGIAVHDNGNTGRKHYVSFPVSIGLSSEADITAKKF